MPDISLTAHRAQLKQLTTSDGVMSYLDIGSLAAEPVLLVHGMPTSSYLYRHIARHLADKGMRAIAPDLLGFGASDKPADASAYAAHRQAARLTQLLDHLGLPAATFVAHDLGGPWTFEVADRQPSRIARLVLLNTSAYADLMTPPREARMVGGPIGPLLLRFMAAHVGRRMIGKFFADFTHAGRRLSPAVIEAHWTPLHEGTTRAFRVFARNLDATMAQFPRYADALRRLDVSASIIWGTEDPVLRVERIVARFAADLGIPAERVHLLDEASHFLQEDRPHDVARLIGDFVKAESRTSIHR